MTGFTGLTNFPTTPGAFQVTNAAGGGDAFITKLNDTGTALIYSTFLGGARYDQGAGIVVDSSGRAFVAGSTNSIDFDVTAGVSTCGLSDGRLMAYPMPNSSGDSSGVPHWRQITAEQSPQVSGSVTSRAHLGQ